MQFYLLEEFGGPYISVFISYDFVDHTYIS